MDTNADGNVSREEWKGPNGAFDRIDLNGDGQISTDEAAQARGSRGDRGGRGPGVTPGAKSREMDVNNDGRISREEWKGPAELFDNIDANDDGFISRDELQQNRPGRAGRGVRANLREMDSNNDGKISKDEWKGPSQLFDRLDSNTDGAVTQEEIRAARGGKNR